MNDDRKLFTPEDAKCGKCGGPIAFYKLPNGKWCPCNPDGSDHWDDCRAAQQVGKYGEEYKNVRPTSAPGIPTYHGNRHVKGKQLYNNPDIPPWDESLGEFRYEHE